MAVEAEGRPGHGGVDLRIVLPLVVAALLVAQVAWTVARLGGHFVYGLDDPYIHLALADQIAAGHYGLTPTAAASPSSSILFPILLAGFTWAGDLAPLLIDGAAALASGWLLARIIEDVFGRTRLAAAPAVVLGVALAVGGNLVGLVLTGMEHSLQVAITLAWVLGALRFRRSGMVEPWWWAAALAEPLIRYEGSVLWIGTVALLLRDRRRAAGIGLLTAGVALIGGFSAFLCGLGLPPLPSSVLVKSGLTNAGTALPDAGPLGRLATTASTNLATFDGTLLSATTFGLALLIERKRRSADASDRMLAELCLVGIAASLAQAGLGRIDFQGRYTASILALHLVMLAAGFAPQIAALARRVPWPVSAAVVIAAMLACPSYAARSLRADRGAADIDAQQRQMHRLAADFYRAPVAVNDLGQVSYRNPYPVVDLWGLGSEEARLARKADPTGRWMDEVLRRHDVGLVMIYDDWFPDRPTRWIAVARLRLTHERVTAGSDVVSFYATAPDRVAAITTALGRLGASLPPGAVLERLDAAAPGLDLRASF